MGRVHYLRTGFTQDPCGDPLLGGQGHYQEAHRADTEHRGNRERYPFPQRRHFRSPWCREEGNTTPGSDPEAQSAITMSLFYSLKKKEITINMKKRSYFSQWHVLCVDVWVTEEEKPNLWRSKRSLTGRNSIPAPCAWILLPLSLSLSPTLLCIQMMNSPFRLGLWAGNVSWLVT